jgi:hypothetical protein
MRHESTSDERLPGRQAATAPRFRVTRTGRCVYAVADDAQPLNQPLTKERDMAAVGKMTIVIVGLAVVAGVVIGVQSLPDLNRYLRIRSM